MAPCGATILTILIGRYRQVVWPILGSSPEAMTIHAHMPMVAMTPNKLLRTNCHCFLQGLKLISSGWSWNQQKQPEMTNDIPFLTEAFPGILGSRNTPPKKLSNMSNQSFQRRPAASYRCLQMAGVMSPSSARGRASRNWGDIFVASFLSVSVYDDRWTSLTIRWSHMKTNPWG